jgi:murein DD-endopeptidase MepM/ murein hydrolase activator NlpD
VIAQATAYRCAPWLVVALLIVAAAFPARAGGLSLTGDAIQGGLMIGQVEPGSRVRFEGNSVRVRPDGRFLIGFGREAPASAVLDIHYPDGSADQRRIEVAAREYEVQRIDGLPSNMVSPSAETLTRIREENQWIAAGRATDSAEPWFDSGFVWPLIGPVTGTYGTQRILNGEPRQPHYGVDVAVPEGAPVYAPADGIVVMAEPDLYYTGGTVMIDHGYGLTSLYSHLSRLDVSVGQALVQGDPIGGAGASGRATGVHLDWRVNLLTTRLDPALLVGAMPSPPDPSGSQP